MGLGEEGRSLTCLYISDDARMAAGIITTKEPLTPRQKRSQQSSRAGFPAGGGGIGRFVAMLHEGATCERCMLGWVGVRVVRARHMIRAHTMVYLLENIRISVMHVFQVTLHSSLSSFTHIHPPSFTYKSFPSSPVSLMVSRSCPGT